MKKLMIGAALAALLASPALAQSYNPTYGTGNSTAMSPSWQAQTDTVGSLSGFSPDTLSRLRGIRAQALPAATDDPVYTYGRYAGADPDSNIRFQLHRDPPGLD